MTARTTTGAVTSVRARRTTTLLAAGLLPLALTACGVGLDPQTYRERTTQDATNAQAGALALRDVAIQPPAAGQSELGVGTDAQLTMAIVNATGDKDTLTGVSSPAASSAKLVDGSGHEVTSVDIPAKGSAEPGDFGVVLIGLTKALRPGVYVDVTFSFATNGKLTLSVPVKLYDHPVPRGSYEPKPAEE
ncbi:MAG: periplasmic copper chaperone [Actinomycetota bacterium]|jgi:copper(I)-binding protein|nr:periplasmic copper chaperone [Actinomycetota bacterium]